MSGLPLSTWFWTQIRPTDQSLAQERILSPPAPSKGHEAVQHQMST